MTSEACVCVCVWSRLIRGSLKTTQKDLSEKYFCRSCLFRWRFARQVEHFEQLFKSPRDAHRPCFGLCFQFLSHISCSSEASGIMLYSTHQRRRRTVIYNRLKQPRVSQIILTMNHSDGFIGLWNLFARLLRIILVYVLLVLPKVALLTPIKHT